jgi:hypothetical protein
MMGDTAHDDAMWLLGFAAAMRGRVPAPMRRDRAGYASAIRTASQVVGDGAFNPLCVWDMQAVARLLRSEMNDGR